MSEPETVAPPTFEQGLREGRLLFQRCVECGQARHPPTQVCPVCRSWEARLEESSGVGTLHSFTIVERAAYPGIPVPHMIGLIEMAEGIRMVAPLQTQGEPVIGMPVCARFDIQAPATINLVFETLPASGDVP